MLSSSTMNVCVREPFPPKTMPSTVEPVIVESRDGEDLRANRVDAVAADRADRHRVERDGPGARDRDAVAGGAVDVHARHGRIALDRDAVARAVGDDGRGPRSGQRLVADGERAALADERDAGRQDDAAGVVARARREVDVVSRARSRRRGAERVERRAGGAVAVRARVVDVPDARRRRRRSSRSPRPRCPRSC